MEQHKGAMLHWVALISALLLAAGCRAQAIAEQPQERIVVESVRVIPLSHIEVRGQTSLPDGACLLTQLSADDAEQSWWPADTCAEVESGRWGLRVQLGTSEAPKELSPDKQYVLRVWERGKPSVEAEPFWFDLSGPPALEE